MKKQTNNIAKIAAISGLCTIAGFSAKAFGVDADIHANFRDGIGANVNADVGLAQANVGANVGLNGVDAEVGADVIGAGANTAAHVGFDGVTARANTYAWDLANVGGNVGATWKDGIYAGGSAKFLESANTAGKALANGQTIYMPTKPAPQGCAWVYGSNGRIVGYKPLPASARWAQQQATVLQPRIDYVMPQPQVVQQPTIIQLVPTSYQQPVVTSDVRTIPAISGNTEVEYQQSTTVIYRRTKTKKIVVRRCRALGE